MSGGLGGAIRFLTVLPAPVRLRPLAWGHPASWFPAAGLLVGAVAYAVLLLPLPALPRAALALAAWVAVTGGLHEDALADCADAAFAVASRERRLEILKDPHIGAHGVAASVLGLLLRLAFLTAVAPVAALVAAVLGRTAMAVSLAALPPARPVGLGAAYGRGARVLPPIALGAGLLALLAVGAGPRTALAVVAAAAAATVTALFLVRRFGGLTGDGHGAVGLLAETAALGAFLPVTAEGA